jgi:hypothetical protein
LYPHRSYSLRRARVAMPGRFLQVLKHVAKPCGRQHGGARALALEDRVGRNGRAPPAAVGSVSRHPLGLTAHSV